MEQRKTPLMGWASWNCFRTQISEEGIRQQADALVNTGLASHGYTYLNIDDGFLGGRNTDGRILAHKKRFPNGMKAVADYIHQCGLSAGIYSDAGDNTCGYYYDNEEENGEGVGLFGHEEQDLNTYLVDWGYDFIKVDWCGGIRLGLDEEEQYSRIGKIIEEIRQKENRRIVYNICRWQFPGAWAAKVADSWRTGADISPCFDSVLHQLDMIKPLRQFCLPGHVNDLDMLQVGNGMSLGEDRTHFAMWCMMSTPLMLGCDLTKISAETMEILTNDELIAINQDKACLQAFVAKEFRKNGELTAEIWVKNLGKDNSNEKAVAFLNRSNQDVEMSAQLNEIGLTIKGTKQEAIKVRDLMNHNDLDFTDSFEFTIKPHECKVLRITAPMACKLEDKVRAITNLNINRVTVEQARESLRAGAILIDVRTKEEFYKKHEKGAINIPYTDIHAAAPKMIPDKQSKIITYCGTGKRCYQAAKGLAYLGYDNVSYMSLT